MRRQQGETDVSPGWLLEVQATYKAFGEIRWLLNAGMWVQDLAVVCLPTNPLL